MPTRPVITFAHLASGLTFGFWLDRADPTVLHVTARHGTTPEDAIAPFFAGQTLWDEVHERFETFADTHGLYWFWWENGRRVGVISCFRREDR